MLETLLGAAGNSGNSVSFYVVPKATSFNEGSEIEFTIYPTDHQKNVDYHWVTGGTLPETLLSVPTGTIQFDSDEPVTVTIQTQVDEFREALETVTLQVIPRADSTVILGESEEVSVVYTSHPTGSHLQVAAEERTWTVPTDVTNIAVVCVGAGQGADGTPRGAGGTGGDLRWRNEIPVVPGEQLTITVGKGGENSSDLALRKGGSSSIKRGDSVILSASGGGGTGSTSLAVTNVGGGNGARGARGGEFGPGGGGGAGGYTGNGGVGGNALVESAPGEGGAGGGGNYYMTDTNNTHHATPGGGVGLYGQGPDGNAGVRGEALVGGGGGSGGVDGSWLEAGVYGGGARGQSSNINFGGVTGGNGAVHIVWGPARFFPNNRIVINGN